MYYTTMDEDFYMTLEMQGPIVPPPLSSDLIEKHLSKQDAAKMVQRYWIVLVFYVVLLGVRFNWIPAALFVMQVSL